jgi:hypothetical protein
MANKPLTKQKSGETSLIKETPEQMPLIKNNFVLMAVAGVMIVLGFALMAGGATDWNSFNEDIFSMRRIVIGPTISFLGFLFMGFAIMYTPKNRK